MERRDFIILAAAGCAGTLTLQGCSAGGENLKPLYIANDRFIPGADYWYATVCRECPAGCGVIVRKRDGRANKIEGNPLHPISRGRACARGQSALTTLYNPDRIKGPRKRAGERGAGQWEDITWDEAIKTVVDRLNELRARNQSSSVAWVEGAESYGRYRTILDRFARAYGAASVVYYSPFPRTAERAASLASFGRGVLPSYDLASADYVLSFGARFLETWASPVYYSRGYGEMRRGGRLRGRFVHAEPRMSLTAANADEWLPVKPGAEGDLARAIAYELGELQGKSRTGAALPENIEEITGIRAETIKRIASEMHSSQRVAVIGGESASAHTNGVANLTAIHSLGGMVNGAGEVRFATPGGSDAVGALPEPHAAHLSGLAPRLQLLFVHEANPLYHAPSAFKLKEAFAQIPLIVSFSSFEDETTSVADLILPDHTAFERWDDDLPQEGVRDQITSISQPVVEPLYNTRQTGDVLLEIARTVPSLAAELRDEIYIDVLKREHLGDPEDADGRWEEATLQGGFWLEEQTKAAKGAPLAVRQRIADPLQVPASFDGDEAEFPFHFLPYEHIALGDGRGANSPVLQELPDPMTSVCWGSWVEINPETAARLGVVEGDMVAVESRHGRVEAHAVVYPGIRPEVVAMPAGQGHTGYGRYAQGRGANPLQILAPIAEPQSGQLAWAATRVRVTRIGGKGRIAMFGTSERVLEEREGMHR
ncbi:MAG: molybdopterin-dependent oxidoreductase [Blastocatellales bacterium]|nr:molybdopterin-dependent oxidoreductase [Blastocatellales bacterium]